MTQWQSSKPSVSVRSLLPPSRRHACNYPVQATMMETYDRKVVEFLPKLTFSIQNQTVSVRGIKKSISSRISTLTYLFRLTPGMSVVPLPRKPPKRKLRPQNVFVLPSPLLQESSLNTMYTIFPFSKVILIIPLLRSTSTRRTINLIQLSTSHVWPGNDAQRRSVVGLLLTSRTVEALCSALR